MQKPGNKIYLSQAQVLRLHMDTLREGVQNFTCAGVLLANTHQELWQKTSSQYGGTRRVMFFTTASGKGLVTHLDGFAVGLPGKIKYGENLLLLWQGYRQIKKRVKSDGDLRMQR